MQTDPGCLRASLRCFALVCLLASVVGLPASVQLSNHSIPKRDSDDYRKTPLLGPSSVDSDEDPASDESDLEDDTLDDMASENLLSIQAFLDSSVKAFDPVIHSINEFFQSLVSAMHDQYAPAAALPPSHGKLGDKIATQGRRYQAPTPEYLFYRRR